MKPYEISLFKSFLTEKAMVTPFLCLYRKYKLKGNPESVEDYLREVDVEQVCMKAFYWVVNQKWGYDYWLGLQKAFTEYVKRTPARECDLPWWNFHGRCKTLRTNWDAADGYWKKESRTKTAERWGVVLPEKLEDQRFIAEIENAVLDEPNNAPLLDFADDSDKHNDVMGEFEFVDVARPKRSILKADEISINMRSHKHSITFNQEVSRELRKRGGYEYAALMRNAAGDVVLNLNDVRGVSMIDGRADNKDGGNSIINSKALVEALAKALDINKKYVIANIKQIAKTDDYVVYQVTKKD
jgi:hypothetical protein